MASAVHDVVVGEDSPYKYREVAQGHLTKWGVGKPVVSKVRSLAEG